MPSETCKHMKLSLLTTWCGGVFFLGRREIFFLDDDFLRTRCTLDLDRIGQRQFRLSDRCNRYGISQSIADRYSNFSRSIRRSVSDRNQVSIDWPSVWNNFETLHGLCHVSHVSITSQQWPRCDDQDLLTVAIQKWTESSCWMHQLESDS